LIEAVDRRRQTRLREYADFAPDRDDWQVRGVSGQCRGAVRTLRIALRM